MVELELPKLQMTVRSRSPAPIRYSCKMLLLFVYYLLSISFRKGMTFFATTCISDLGHQLNHLPQCGDGVIDILVAMGGGDKEFFVAFDNAAIQ